jgi:hypothetical protein
MDLLLRLRLLRVVVFAQKQTFFLPPIAPRLRRRRFVVLTGLGLLEVLRFTRRVRLLLLEALRFPRLDRLLFLAIY